MRITSELKTKINRELNKKYAKTEDTIRKNYQSMLEEQRPAIVEYLSSLIQTDSIVSAIFHKACSYGTHDVTQFVAIHDEMFFPEACKQYHASMQEIRRKCEADYETLAIAISYEKSLDGIKAAFTEMGLTF